MSNFLQRLGVLINNPSFPYAQRAGFSKKSFPSDTSLCHKNAQKAQNTKVKKLPLDVCSYGAVTTIDTAMVCGTPPDTVNCAGVVNCRSNVRVCPEYTPPSSV